MTEDAVTKLLKTVERVERLEAELKKARGELRDDLRAAHADGETISGLSRRLGLSRTRVRQLLDEEYRA